MTATFNHDYVSREEAANMLNVSVTHPDFKRLWDQAQKLDYSAPLSEFLENNYISAGCSGMAAGAASLVHDDKELHFVQIAQSRSVVLLESDVEVLGKCLPEAAKRSGSQANLLDIMRNLGVPRDEVIGSALVQAHVAGNETVQIADLPDEFKVIDLQYSTLRHKVEALHFPEDQLPLVAKYFHRIAPSDEEQFLDQSAVAAQLGTKLHTPKFNKAWNALENAAKGTSYGESSVLNGQKIDARQKITGALKRISLNCDDVDAFRSIMEEGVQQEASPLASMFDLSAKGSKGKGR